MTLKMVPRPGHTKGASTKADIAVGDMIEQDANCAGIYS